MGLTLMRRAVLAARKQASKQVGKLQETINRLQTRRGRTERFVFPGEIEADGDEFVLVGLVAALRGRMGESHFRGGGGRDNGPVG